MISVHFPPLFITFSHAFGTLKVIVVFADTSLSRFYLHRFVGLEIEVGSPFVALFLFPAYTYSCPWLDWVYGATTKVLRS